MARKLLAAVALLTLGGCNFYYNDVPSPDDLMKAVPWFDHMITSRAASPYQRADIPRLTVPGTVPVTGSEGHWATGDASKLQYAFDIAVADRVTNPTRPEETLAKGDTLYHTFCSVCHGTAGAGDGAVGVKMAAPPIVSDRARAYTDGYLYSIIRYGRGVMPMYGDKVYHPADRWAIVNYVRKLQRDAAPVAAPGGAR
ncbi:MAG: cytochrome c [Gemmatimonadales bacterium]|nr:cytochrome c [Gemmatimonadales bacterium]